MRLVPPWFRALLPSHHLATLQAHLARFEAIPELGYFQESRPRLHFTEQAIDHAVLLLHGYSSSTQTFDTLGAELERRGVSYHAPLITGFGLDRLDLLSKVRASDWLRDAVLSFDLLAAVARRVSIVGVSTGATLGAYVAQHRPVDHLVLIAPNLRSSARDLRYRRLLRTPVVSDVFFALKPYFSKPIRPGRRTNRDLLDPHMAEHHLDFPVLPSRSALAVWDAQDHVDLRQMRSKHLLVVAGKHDQTVDMDHAFSTLTTLGLPHDRLILENSAHNVLIDQERDLASRLIADHLVA
jgi:esterase/lipase